MLRLMSKLKYKQLRQVFNQRTLQSLSYVSMPTTTFNQYFGHIPFYHIKELDIITWAPNELLTHLNYYTVDRIYLINDDHVVILPNFKLKIL